MQLTNKSLFEGLRISGDRYRLLLALGDTRPVRREYRAAKFKRVALQILAKQGVTK